MKYLVASLLVTLLLLIANIVFLDFSYGKVQRDLTEQRTLNVLLSDRLDELARTLSVDSLLVASNSAVSDSMGGSCPQSCIGIINAVTQTLSQNKTSPNVVGPATMGPTEYIIPFGIGTVNQIGTWVNIDSAQAQIDPANYPRMKAAYFEVVMHIPNAQGVLKARLMEKNTPFIYYGNELTTTSGTGQLLSVPVNLRPTNSSYEVQMYTSISAGSLDSARIRIVTQ